MSPTQHFLYEDTDPRHRKAVEEAVNAQEAEPQDVLAEIEARYKLSYDETRRPLDTAPPMERALWQARQDVLTLITALRAALVRTPETLDDTAGIDAAPGTQIAMDALKAAVLWLDGEYVDRPRSEFNRVMWGQRAREGIRALVDPVNAEGRAYSQGHRDGMECGVESAGFGYTGCDHVGSLAAALRTPKSQ